MEPNNFAFVKTTFEREVVDIMRDFKVPGMSFLIMRDGEVFYNRSFGYRNLDVRKPATSNTLYGIASITKSMTCLAILQLHQESKLNIHDPISDYLPITWIYKDNPITLHHLMSHSSGMPCLNSYEFIMVNQGWNANIPTFPLGNWDDFYLHLNEANSELLYPPNTKYFYWNGGFTLLGQGLSSSFMMILSVLDSIEVNVNRCELIIKIKTVTIIIDLYSVIFVRFNPILGIFSFLSFLFQFHDI